MEGEQKPSKAELLRRLPSVHQVLERVRGDDWAKAMPAVFLREAVRHALERARRAIQEGTMTTAPDTEEVCRTARQLLPQVLPLMPRTINATGIIVHTGLGRSLLSQRALDRLTKVATSACALEIDEVTGERSFRDIRIEKLLTFLTGAEAATVVNNNAAAVLLILNTHAEDREVIVSRGELVEIGGGFRIPEILKKSGARLVEVGTTNKTRRKDYEEAITERTALILKVHKSNFRIVGFSEEVPLAELVDCARRYQLPVVEDLGSGALVDVSRAGIEKEPLVQESVKQGADLVCFSGDKLLGGPQAGIIVGKKHLIEPLRKNPLYRAFRVDKLTLAALEGTLLAYADPEGVWDEVPTLRAIIRPAQQVRKQSARLIRMLLKGGLPRSHLSLIASQSQVGGGALPDQFLPTWCVRIQPPNGVSADDLSRRLRCGIPSVIGRVQDNAVLLDMRTVQQHEMAELAEAVVQAWESVSK
ncbi:MAG: L-seryl-tRNA(Sec) selenium transferase [Armatimonadetes bacterium]|nr:L-seryl-tRNA(Sec) selenium transferase [Armatimonadota bacterium]MDW8120821.1 L-seryl-tRNA(Sec) selenium transferase [Armatimonadota bacterium]